MARKPVKKKPVVKKTAAKVVPASELPLAEQVLNLKRENLDLRREVLRLEEESDSQKKEIASVNEKASSTAGIAAKESARSASLSEQVVLLQRHFKAVAIEFQTIQNDIGRTAKWAMAVANGDERAIGSNLKAHVIERSR